MYKNQQTINIFVNFKFGPEINIFFVSACSLGFRLTSECRRQGIAAGMCSRNLEAKFTGGRDPPSLHNQERNAPASQLGVSGHALAAKLSGGRLCRRISRD